MSWNAFRKGLQLVHLWAGLILAMQYEATGHLLPPVINHCITNALYKLWTLKGAVG